MKLPEITGVSFVLDMPARLKSLTPGRVDLNTHAAKYSCGCSFCGVGAFPEICPEHPDGRWLKDLTAVTPAP